MSIKKKMGKKLKSQITPQNIALKCQIDFCHTLCKGFPSVHGFVAFPAVLQAHAVSTIAGLPWCGTWISCTVSSPLDAWTPQTWGPCIVDLCNFAVQIHVWWMNEWPGFHSSSVSWHRRLHLGASVDAEKQTLKRHNGKEKCPKTCLIQTRKSAP